MKRWKPLALVGVAVRRGSSASRARPASRRRARRQQRGRDARLVAQRQPGRRARRSGSRSPTEYHAAHPDVTIKVGRRSRTRQFTNTKIPIALQSNDPPDVFQNWGGGQLVDQVKAGKVTDITKYVAPWIKSIGGVGRGLAGQRQAVRRPVQPRHRRVLVQQGALREGRDHVAAEDLARSSSPTSSKLKAADITPIAIGGKDRWPDAFYWDYLATTLCSKSTMQQSAVDVQLQRPVLAQGRRSTCSSCSTPSRSRTASSARPPSRARAARPA